jgi:hypothetical protein
MDAALGWAKGPRPTTDTRNTIDTKIAYGVIDKKLFVCEKSKSLAFLLEITVPDPKSRPKPHPTTARATTLLSPWPTMEC